MNRRGVLLPVLLLALGAPIHAQTPAGCAPMVPASASPASQHGTALWDYQTELSLSTAQVDKIHSTYDSFQKKMMDNEQKLRGLSQEIAGLVRQSADITTIRAKMQQAANLQVDVSIEDIQTGRAISAILTPSQRKQWADIQTQLRVQQGAIPPPNK
ncbi:MAG TPA: hypothetical protein VGO93_02655 [Candidatus Xenobia bacterium]